MRKLTLIGTLALASMVANTASAYENPLFGYTHMLPAPYTLKAGRVVLGTDMALGITNFLQIGTSLLYDFYKVLNANAKVSILDYPEFALSLTLGFQSYNYQDIAVTNPDLRVNTWMPGIVTAYGILPDLALFVGGNLNISQVTPVVNSIDTSGFVHGMNIESDLSWAYNPHAKSVGNVISAGATYDFTYKIYGVGISHTWPGFHLGIHYYPNATAYKVQPILAGGAVVDL